jgi:hypothetical protein
MPLMVEFGIADMGLPALPHSLSFRYTDKNASGQMRGRRVSD